LKKYLRAGFVITCIGDKGDFTYKKSRIGNALPDRAVELLLQQTEASYNIEDFFPGDGSDERQYCSPGFNLPVGSLMRTRYGKYHQYHTSGDDKSFISFEAMEASINKYMQVVEIIEKNHLYTSTMPFCEPQLGKRGLYPTIGSQKSTAAQVEAMLWVLNYADGSHDLIDIASKSKLSIFQLADAAVRLEAARLLRRK
jgi:aminopeptidase-like protein